MHEATLPLLNLAILGSFMIFSASQLAQTNAERTPEHEDGEE